MRRKRQIDTREVYKWKAGLNIDGSKQTKGINSWETYAPVATWPSIRFIMLQTLLQGWHTGQLDYVQAYPQADIEVDLYMQIPKGFEVKRFNDR
jgi:Reverse transcriptase (RNA-dependent DNA polymerase)